MWHRVLERQIRHYLGENASSNASDALKNFFQSVSDTYTHFDDDRKLLLRSLDISSKEFVELNKQLQSENQIIEKKVQDRTQQLAFEQIKLSQIAEHMPTGALLLNADGAVTLINKKASRLLSTTEPTESVQKLAELFPALPVLEYVRTSLNGESVEIPEVDAENHIFALSFVTLLKETRTFGSLIWIRDITAQKLLERAKNQFLAIASHEMRTPLTIIRGNAELLHDNKIIKENTNELKRVESIMNSAVRLLGIVNDFLDVQHLESGKLALRIEDIDIREVLTTTVTDLRRLSDEKNIYIHFDPPEDIRKIPLDRYRLQQVCINLISNAIHYTKEGGITVTIEKLDMGLKVHFSDTGIGISPEDQLTLFRKFQTGKTFLRSREYGSGLGLYISNMISRYMGLTLSLEESAVGVGTTFCLEIPYAPERQQNPGVEV